MSGFARFGAAPLWTMVLSLVACREATGPWEAGPVQADSVVAARITFSPGNDMYPAWSPDGQVVLYAAESFAGMPPGSGLLLAIGRLGGTAQLVFPDLQGASAGGPRRLAASGEAATGGNVVYLDVVRINPQAPIITQAGCTIPEPPLDSVVIRVRKRGETRSILDDPAVSIRLAGPDRDQRTGGPGPFTVRMHPFQRWFMETGLVPLRGSWSPDGRFVYSDGLHLLIRSPDGSTAEVPGTSDAVSPAWSPDGEWIAFTRLERGDSTVQVCDIAEGNRVLRQLRVGYAGSRTAIVRVRPDGSGMLELAEGETPGWSPDGAYIYFADARGIARVGREGGVATALAGTEGGQWPGVAPDGGRLVFMRQEAGTGWDLWSAPLAR